MTKCSSSSLLMHTYYYMPATSLAIYSLSFYSYILSRVSVCFFFLSLLSYDDTPNGTATQPLYYCNAPCWDRIIAWTMLSHTYRTSTKLWYATMTIHLHLVRHLRRCHSGCVDDDDDDHAQQSLLSEMYKGYFHILLYIQPIWW